MSLARASTAEVQLFAVESSGSRRLAVEAQGGSVHDVLEKLPGGVYSALRTFGHERFLWLDAHLDRTERSMAGLGWSAPFERALLKRALDEVVRASPSADAGVRFDVLREPAPVQGARAAMFIALSPFTPVSPEFMREGVRVDFAPHLRRETPRIKTTDFVRARKPMPIGTRERFDHILVDERQCILECSSANIVFVRGRELVCAGEGVLEGITLKVLLHLAPALGLAVRSECLPRSELARVDECLLSSSIRGPVPIVTVESQPIGDGRVGPVTRALIEAYYAFAAREARPAL